MIRTQLFKISKDDQATILSLLAAFEQIPRPRPKKFDLANQFFSNLVLEKPSTLAELNGLLDSIGGYVVATHSAVKQGLVPERSTEGCADLMRIAQVLGDQARAAGMIGVARL